MTVESELKRIIDLRDELSIKLSEMSLTEEKVSLRECVDALLAVIPHRYSFNTITSKDHNLFLPEGYYHEGAEVGISDEDKENISGENIRMGVSILGTFGTFTSDATAKKSDILSGKTAYVNGELITGTGSGAELPELNVPAYPSDVLKYCEYIDGDGVKQVGEMLSHISEEHILDCTSPEFTIPQGYHEGSGKVKIVPESVEITPSAVDMTVSASTGKVISSVTVKAASGGGSYVQPDETKPVRFYDYDGTLLYSYTHEEISAMTTLPETPTHPGLTSQGWNWELSDLKNLSAEMNVGAMYTTVDGATRLHIVIDDTLRREIPLYFYQSVDNGVTIDWGDGSAVETVSGTSYVSTSHTYPAAGNYTISLLPLSTCALRLGHNSGSAFVFGPTGNYTRVIANMLRGVNIGVRCTTLNSYTFQYCRSLEYITIPSTVTSLGSYTFHYCGRLKCIIVPTRPSSLATYTFGYCYSLRTVSLPIKTTSVGASCFRYCYSLENVTLPPNLATLNGYSFSECYALRKIYLPDSLKTIGNYAFNKCWALGEVRLPGNLTSIGSNVFYQNYALSEIDIPGTVTTIGTYAFYDCHALKSIVVPEGVTAINSATFYNCYGMKAYYIYAVSPPTLQSTAFNNIAEDCIIYIPQGSYDAYIADTAWQTVGEHLAEM